MADLKPPRVIELITVLVVASILTAVLMPHCHHRDQDLKSGRTSAPSSAKP